MSTSPASENTANDPLCLDRCPDCGYLLTGLPEQGICPECGAAYQPGLIVLCGWARGRAGDPSNTRRWRWVGSMASLLLVLAAYVNCMRGFSWQNPYPLLLVAIGVWGIVQPLWRRRQLLQDLPAPVQLRLSARGFEQRNGCGPIMLQPWGRMRVDLRWLGLNRHGIRIAEPRRAFRPSSDPVADFEFDCTVQTATQLRQQVQQWLQEARRSAPSAPMT